LTTLEKIQSISSHLDDTGNGDGIFRANFRVETKNDFFWPGVLEMKMFSGLIASLILFASFQVVAADAVPVTTDKFHTTAQSLYLRQSPLADLLDLEVQPRVASIEKEVRLVFAALLTAKGQAYFHQSLPWVAGEVIVGFQDSTRNGIQKLMGASKVIPVAQLYAGYSDLATAFISVAGGELENRGSYFVLKINPNSNPRVAAATLNSGSLKTLGIKYAEANGFFGGGGPRLIRTEVPKAVLYVFVQGWGDCMAGCISGHRDYYEIENGSSVVKYVGSSGETSPATDLFIKSGN